MVLADLGSAVANAARYNGSAAPPAYDLARFAAPLAVFVGSGDRLADPRDAVGTLRLLRPGARLVANVTVGGGWGHGDFIWSVHAAQRVYRPLIALLDAAPS